MEFHFSRFKNVASFRFSNGLQSQKRSSLMISESLTKFLRNNISSPVSFTRKSKTMRSAQTLNTNPSHSFISKASGLHEVWGQIDKGEKRLWEKAMSFGLVHEPKPIEHQKKKTQIRPKSSVLNAKKQRLFSSEKHNAALQRESSELEAKSLLDQNEKKKQNQKEVASGLRFSLVEPISERKPEEQPSRSQEFTRSFKETYLTQLRENYLNGKKSLCEPVDLLYSKRNPENNQNSLKFDAPRPSQCKEDSIPKNKQGGSKYTGHYPFMNEKGKIISRSSQQKERETKKDHPEDKKNEKIGLVELNQLEKEKMEHKRALCFFPSRILSGQRLRNKRKEFKMEKSNESLQDSCQPIREFKKRNPISLLLNF